MDMIDRKNQVIVNLEEDAVYINGNLTEIRSMNIISVKRICVNINQNSISVIAIHLSNQKWYFIIEDSLAYKKLIDSIIDRRGFGEISSKANVRNEEFYFLCHAISRAIEQSGKFQSDFFEEERTKYVGQIIL